MIPPELNPRTDFVPTEEMIIDDLETLKVLADPLRLRIRELMTEPTTVKKVAEELSIPATKLYYHINLLEKHGLIVLVDTRIVSGIIEKHYQIAARSVRVARHLLSPASVSTDEGITVALTGLMEDVKADILASVAAGTAVMAEDAKRHEGVTMGSMRFLLSEQQAAEFLEQYTQLIEKVSQQSRSNQEAKPSGTHNYKLMNIFFPSSRKHPASDDHKK